MEGGKNNQDEGREDLQFQNGQVDTGVQSQASLVGSESRIVLYSVSSVDLEVAFVILPCNPELNDSLGNLNDVKSPSVLGVLGQKGFLWV